MEEQAVSTDEILQRIFDARGFEVRIYKISSLQRGISRRMDVLGIPNPAEYLEYIETNPDEYRSLFNTILVNVSRFFRDPEAWDFVRKDILPEILEGCKGELRIWSAGCASGEEPYSLAITLADMLGDDLSKPAIRIYATDIDEAALKFARIGTYTFDQLEGVPEYVREKYFIRRGNAYAIARHIRDLLIFSRHNLVSDPPISHIDLLLCRNVLIYFNQALQAMIIPKLQYALSDTGYLWLGKAETLVTKANSLRLANVDFSLFKKTPPSAHSRVTARYAGMNSSESYISGGFERNAENDSASLGFIILDSDLNVATCSETIREIYSSLPEQILGTPFFDLEISYSPVDLKHRIEQVIATKEVLVVESAEYWISPDKRIYLRIEVVPLVSGVMILLMDVTEQYELNKESQFAYEALETENERLLSANKDLESINRRLQSINEELQSTNEEMEFINQDLKERNGELSNLIAHLSALNRCYETVFNSADFGVIVTDGNLLIKMWNDAAADLWGNAHSDSSNEVFGRPIMSLDIGLPLERLAGQFRHVMRTGKPAADTLERVDHQGKKTMIDVSVTH